MDLTSHDLQRDVLDASLRFAHAIGAEVVVCHAGQRVAARDARNSMRDQLGREVRPAGGGRSGGRTGCDHRRRELLSEQPILRGAVYDYSVWPSQLAEQISRVDHPAVGARLDASMRPRGSRLRLRLYRGVHRPGTTRAPRTPSRQPAEDQPHGPAVSGALRVRAGRSAPPAGQGHHPARGPVAADELSRKPSCCVELSPELFPLVPEALGATRELILKAASRERVSA